MSTTRGVEARERRRRKIKKNARRHDISDPRFNLADENEVEKERRWFSSFFALFVRHTESYEFFSPVSTFHPPFPVPLFKPSPLPHASNARAAAFNADTRGKRTISVPRVLFSDTTDGDEWWLRGNENRDTFFSRSLFLLVFSLSLFSFFLFLFLRSVKINVSKKSLVLQFRYGRKFFSSTCESW